MGKRTRTKEDTPMRYATAAVIVLALAACGSSTEVEPEVDVSGIWWVEVHEGGHPDLGPPSSVGWVEIMEIHGSDGVGRLCEDGERLQFALDAGWIHPRLRMTWRDFRAEGEFWSSPVDREEVMDVYWVEEGRLDGTFVGEETVIVLVREPRWPSGNQWCS